MEKEQYMTAKEKKIIVNSKIIMTSPIIVFII